MARRKNADVSVLDLHPAVITLWYVVSALLILALYALLWYYWRQDMLVNVNQLMGNGRSITEGLSRVWYIFAWALGINLVFGYFIRDNTRGAGETFAKGWWLSINAGFFEEIIYRWLVFFNAMVLLRAFNFLTFGLIKWIYTQVLVPLANWATLGHLKPELLGHSSWVFGGAIVSASISFRNTHKGLGLFGFINSWFIGMVMFWLLFHYGLWAAIWAHILYDGTIFTVAAVIAKLREPKLAYW